MPAPSSRMYFIDLATGNEILHPLNGCPFSGEGAYLNAMGIGIDKTNGSARMVRTLPARAEVCSWLNGEARPITIADFPGYHAVGVKVWHPPGRDLFTDGKGTYEKFYLVRPLPCWADDVQAAITKPASEPPLWTKTTDGFCAEISAIGVERKRVGDRTTGNIRLPNDTTVPWHCWVGHHDPEGDITHWTYEVGGVLYTIFND